MLSSNSNHCYNIYKRYGFVEGSFTSPKVRLVKKKLAPIPDHSEKTPKCNQ